MRSGGVARRWGRWVKFFLKLILYTNFCTLRRLLLSDASYSQTPLLRVRRTPTFKNVSIFFKGLSPARVIWWRNSDSNKPVNETSLCQVQTNKPVKFKNGRSAWVKIWMLSGFAIRCRYIYQLSAHGRNDLIQVFYYYDTSSVLTWEDLKKFSYHHQESKLFCFVKGKWNCVFWLYFLKLGVMLPLSSPFLSSLPLPLFYSPHVARIGVNASCFEIMWRLGKWYVDIDIDNDIHDIDIDNDIHGGAPPCLTVTPPHHASPWHPSETASPPHAVRHFQIALQKIRWQEAKMRWHTSFYSRQTQVQDSTTI